MPAKHTYREFIENHPQHIFNRGVEKRVIFTNQQDYRTFLYYLTIYLAKPKTLETRFPTLPGNLKINNVSEQIKLLTYCFMPNHFHLHLAPTNIETSQEIIPKFMRQLSNAYTGYFNKKYDRVGPLFQGRYKSVLVSSDEQNVHLHRYIQTNPLTAKLVKNLQDWPWSSYHEYVGGQKLDDICQIEDIFSRFKNLDSYKNFLLEQVDTESIESILLD
ncbi:transposase [Patescibacteria group bacterium]|nr:transposase [Patescibacteria group bacterium]MBU1457411.1 transposase [Patescibacteria group bacterium]